MNNKKCDSCGGEDLTYYGENVYCADCNDDNDKLTMALDRAFDILIKEANE